MWVIAQPLHPSITALCHYLQYSYVPTSPVTESPVFRCPHISSAGATHPLSITALYATIFRFKRTQSSFHHFSLTQSPVFRSAHSPSFTALYHYLQYSGVPSLPPSLLSTTISSIQESPTLRPSLLSTAISSIQEFPVSLHHCSMLLPPVFICSNISSYGVSSLQVSSHLQCRSHLPSLHHFSICHYLQIHENPVLFSSLLSHTISSIQECPFSLLHCSLALSPIVRSLSYLLHHCSLLLSSVLRNPHPPFTIPPSVTALSPFPESRIPHLPSITAFSRFLLTAETPKISPSLPPPTISNKKISLIILPALLSIISPVFSSLHIPCSALLSAYLQWPGVGCSTTLLFCPQYSDVLTCTYSRDPKYW